MHTDLRTALRRLESIGLILTEERLAAEREPGGAKDFGPLGIAIVTHGDPGRILRALGSYAERAPESALSVYSDAADDLQLRACIKSISARCSAELLARLELSGHRELSTYCMHLAADTRARGVPEETLSFALRGRDEFDYRAGATRNRFLLDRAGSPSILCDDDVTADYFQAGDESVLDVSSRIDPSVLLFDTAARPLRLERSGEGGIRRLHETLLGRSGRELVLDAARNRRLSLTATETSCLEALFRCYPRVVASAAGDYSDSGTGSLQRILRLEGDSRDAVMSGQLRYESAVARGRVLRAAKTRVLSDSPFLRACNVGLDLRTLLPPFLPSGQNDEGIFGLLISRCYPPGCIGHVPAAMIHEQASPGNFDRDLLTAVQVQMSDIINLLIQNVAVRPITANRFCRTEEAADAMRAIGGQLNYVGSWSAEGFEEYVEELWLRRASAEIEELEELLDRHRETPRFWARDVKVAIRAIEEFAIRESPAVPADMNLPPGTPRKERILRCQNFVRAFGRLLFHWPEIVASARDLRAAGITLSRPLG